MENFISCDWGTSNFRLRLVAIETLEIISEHSTNMGVKKLYEAFKNSDSILQKTYFIDYLKQQIELFLTKKNNIPTIVISGMATSSIGMLELPYVLMPLNFKGDNLISKIITEKELKIILISGAQTDFDLMRGEETQALGLVEDIPEDTTGILILPGTHSKHIQFKGGKFTSFTTFLTGELFEVISKKTILQNSLMPTSWDIHKETHFLEGVQKGLNNQHLAYLFSVRANDLLNKKSKEENFFFLSGLLIGGELAYLKETNKSVYIGTTGELHQLYYHALKQIKISSNFFDQSTMDKALLIGQKKILRSYE